MIAMPFDYTRATSLEEAIEKYTAAEGAGMMMAGGHSLVPLMNLRLSEPGTLIDIARLPGLGGIKTVGDKIEIGAATVHDEMATSSLVRDVVRCSRRRPPPSAISRFAIEARSAAASRTPIRPRIIPPRCSPSTPTF
jgi:hypothetical protein